MSLTESAVLLCLHAVRMSLFILRHVIVALLAFRACQCDLCAHDFHLRLILCKAALFLPSAIVILSIKKRPLFFHSPDHCNIQTPVRQAISQVLKSLRPSFPHFCIFFMTFSTGSYRSGGAPVSHNQRYGAEVSAGRPAIFLPGIMRFSWHVPFPASFPFAQTDSESQKPELLPAGKFRER